MEKKWWMEAVGYEIYIKSFNDTNGDGVGDVRGIIEKLDYIASIGVDLIWVTPFYKSPMDDNGYDVSDYYSVDPIFGNIEDIKELVDKAKKRGIKIIIDLVLNHTSDEHPWFFESRKNTNSKYRDYYIWSKGKNSKDGKELPPTNWGSFFGGSAWNKDEVSNEYYMKIFSNKMPDLNWNSKELRYDMYKMIKWWLDLGIDGFRVDAVSHLGKAPLEDSKLNIKGDYAMDWSRFSSLPIVHDHIVEMMKEISSEKDIVTIGEVGGGAVPEEAIKYAGKERNEFSMIFIFDHFDNTNKKNGRRVSTNLINLKKAFSSWQNRLYNKAWMPVFWLNHDHARVASRYGDINYHKESCKMLATAVYFMHGTPFVYNGEEIGMTNYPFKNISDFDDVSIKNRYNLLIEEGASKKELEEFFISQCEASRDNSRSPMQWSKEENAGFTKGKPWFPVNPNYKNINVYDEEQDKDSILNFYKKIFDIRKNSKYKDTIVYGTYTMILEKDENVYGYIRENEKEKILILCNFFKEKAKISLDYEVKEIIINNYISKEINLKELELKAFECLVISIN